MKKSILLFVLAFVIGAGVALAIRTARHKPHPPVEPAPATAPAAPADDHSAHQAAAVSTPVNSVNTVCAICGMDVDSSLPTALYEGKKIGFGCQACPPKFAANPAKYGPYALKNEVIP